MGAKRRARWIWLPTPSANAIGERPAARFCSLRRCRSYQHLAQYLQLSCLAPQNKDAVEERPQSEQNEGRKQQDCFPDFRRLILDYGVNEVGKTLLVRSNPNERQSARPHHAAKHDRHHSRPSGTLGTPCRPALSANAVAQRLPSPGFELR